MSVLMTQRHAVYEDSGIEWLGAKPAHWALARIKEVAYINAKTLPDNTAPDYEFDYVDIGSVTYGVSGYTSEKMSFRDAPSRAKRIVRNGDTIVSTVRTYLKAVTQIGVADNLIVSTGFAVLSPHKLVDGSFFSKWLMSDVFISQVSAISKGVSYPATNATEIGNLFIFLPPISEQAGIAAYLDAKTKQIDRKIDLLTKKVEKYGTLKKSLITETVMRGLDKTVPLKESGIEWFGQVPAHWKFKRLKELASIQNSNVDKKSDENEIRVRLCNYVDVYKNEFIDSRLAKSFMWATADVAEVLKFGIKKNDVLITKDSETADDIAVPALVTETLDGVLCGYHLAQIKTNTKLLLGAYLFRLFQSESYGHRFEISAKGITRVGLGQSAIADAMTPIPSLEEQMSIAAYLNERTKIIDDIVQKINGQIKNLNDLRKSLINDVVTGKIKVVSEG
jgi:type I restriction enzyme S subunit